MVTVIGPGAWHRLPRRLRRRYQTELGRRWFITDLDHVARLYVLDGRVIGAEVYLRDSDGRHILKGHDVARLRVGRAHG